MSTRYLTLHWFPREDDPAGEPRLGLAVPKSVGNAVVRNRLKRQLRETWQELADADSARPRLRARRAAGRRRAGRHARPRVARRAGDRGAREGGSMRYVGIALVHALALHVRPADAGGDVQVPPELLAVRDRRVPRARPRQGRDLRQLAARSAATRGATAASTARRMRGSGAADPRRSARHEPARPPARVHRTRCVRSSTSSSASSSGCTRRSGSRGRGRSSCSR